MTKLLTKQQVETLPMNELFQFYWNAPFLVLGFIEERDGLFSAHSCHAEDRGHMEMYLRYLDHHYATYELLGDGHYHLLAPRKVAA